MHRVGMVMWKDARAAEESRQHHVPPGCLRGARRQQVRRDNSQQRPQLENVPPFASQNRNRTSIARQRVAFPRDGLDQRGLPAAIRPQDAHVLPRGNFQIHFPERRAVAAHHRHVSERKKRWGHSLLHLDAYAFYGTAILTERAAGPKTPDDAASRWKYNGGK